MVYKWLQEMNVTAFLESGSALGQLRHGGRIIPWDDESDLGFFTGEKWGPVPSDMRSIDHFMQRFKNEKVSSHGGMHRVHPMSQNGDIYCAQYQITFGSPAGNVHVDVFAYAYVPGSEEKNIAVIGKCFRPVSPIPTSSVLPLKACNYFDETVACVADPLTYCRSQFGSNVMGRAVGHGAHYGSVDIVKYLSLVMPIVFFLSGVGVLATVIAPRKCGLLHNRRRKTLTLISYGLAGIGCIMQGYLVYLRAQF